MNIFQNLHLQMTDNRNFQEFYTSTEPFISVSSKEPLVNMEGPPGISSPMKQSSDNRRFSIRPAQLSGQPSPTSTKSTPTPLQTPKPMPRWKATILQRQLGQLNIQRRARAFSLSDVYSSKRGRSAAPVSPLAIDNTNKVMIDRATNDANNKSVDVSKANQKTVTIVSPAEQMNMISKNDLQDVIESTAPADPRNEQSLLRKNQEIVTSSINPFVFDISDKPAVALNKFVISSEEVEKYHQEDGNYEAMPIPVYEESSKENVFEQKIVCVNDAINKNIQIGMQETNIDVKEIPLEVKEKENCTNVCIIDNLDMPQEPSNVKSSTSDRNLLDSKKEKPSVPIDFYKPFLQVTIEKPAVDPFEQYKAMTRSVQKESANSKEVEKDTDTDLKEVKVEKPPET